jgi:hypothetical protein
VELGDSARDGALRVAVEDAPKGYQSIKTDTVGDGR